MEVRRWVMINSESSELEQIVRGNIPPNAYFSEEEHVQMFSDACSRHMLRAMLILRFEHHRLCNASQSVK